MANPVASPSRKALSECSTGQLLTTIWSLWLAEVLLLAIGRPFLPSVGAAGLVAILAHVMAAGIAASVLCRRPAANILWVSLVVRTALVFWDVYMGARVPLLQSGADTEMFYGWAVAVAEDPTLIQADIRGGPYSKLIGIVFSLIGPMRIFGQYTNVLFGISAVIILARILDILKIERALALKVLAAAAFLPISLLLSALFLREAVILFLLSASLLFLVRWFVQGGIGNAGTSVIFLLAATVFHSGVIALILGYGFVFLFYRRERQDFRLGASSVPSLIALVALGYAISRQYPDLFLGKFEGIESTDDLIDISNFRRGESTYLAGMTVDSVRALALYGPLRAIYFLGAPLPWDWRGMADILTFIFDSLAFLFPLFYFMKNARTLGSRRTVAVALLVTVLVVALVFGAGLANAGTAMRHRNKFLIYFLTLAAVILDSKQFHRGLEQAIEPPRRW